MSADLALLAAGLVGAGLFAGFVGGLFGIGGGVVMVPVLFHLFGALGFEGPNLHVAIATSLATIIATSVASLRAHRRVGAVDEAVLRAWLPWVAGGAALGAVLAGQLSTGALALVFGGIGLVVAAQMVFAPERFRLAADLPVGLARAGIGASIGGASALMGIGGGAFGTMLMTLCGRPIHRAVATASGFGAAIGVPATLSYIAFGWDAAGRPPFSLGYVNVPGFVALAILTTLMAPLGAKAAHRLPRLWLKRLFGVMFALIALNIIARG